MKSRNILIKCLATIACLLFNSVLYAQIIIPENKPKQNNNTSPQQATSNKFILKISSNLRCRIKIDGEDKGIVENGGIKKVYLIKGVYKIEAISTENNSDFFSSKYTVIEQDLNTEDLYEIDLLKIRNNRIANEKAAENEKAAVKAKAKYDSIARANAEIAARVKALAQAKSDSIERIKREDIAKALAIAEFKADSTAKAKADSIAKAIESAWNAMPQEIIDQYDLTFVKVNGGYFLMGSPYSEVERNSYETQHRIELSNYYLGKYEVTVAQFKEFVDATGIKTDAEKDGWSWVMKGKKWKKQKKVTWQYDNKGRRYKGDLTENDQAVVHVSWHDASAYCNWLSERTGNDYRLPNEAQWEYAAKGGLKSKNYIFSGSNNIDAVAWYLGNGENRIHAVGLKQPNELGIYDMSGNVSEWCSDWYENAYYEKGPTQNPEGPTDGTERIYRGGFWGANSGDCRASFRNYSNPGNRGGSVGIRLVLIP
ncbi:MAG: SUMF1/EgtB/PvdO family nonheme iron enzyme [Bacteroidota bacterium]